MTERQKYRTVVAPDSVQFDEEINALADEGYSIRHTMDDTRTFIAIMGLKSEANIKDLKKVIYPKGETPVSVPDGWEVYGVYSGHTILVRRT